MSDLARQRLQLISRDGREVELGDIVGAHPTLVVLLRHVDCPFCELHVGRILDRRDELGRVVLVSFDTDDDGARLLEKFPGLPPECLLLGDPERTSYGAVGSRTTSMLLASIHPRLVPRIAVNVLRGRRVTRRGADITQLGADIVLAPSGEVTWKRLSSGPADRPSIDELIAAMRGARSVDAAA